MLLLVQLLHRTNDEYAVERFAHLTLLLLLPLLPPLLLLIVNLVLVIGVGTALRHLFYLLLFYLLLFYLLLLS